jgi:hypothetical protein
MEGKMESGTQHSKGMEEQHKKPLANVLLIGWSLIYLLYVALGGWLGTGKDALAGPRTSLMDYISSSVWLGLGIVQLVVAIVLSKTSKRWLWWASISFAMLSLNTVLIPPLIAPFFPSSVANLSSKGYELNFTGIH